jgi:JmjC domain, hydroxylase
MFGWHKEDLDLYSINFLHSGKPKQWYGVDLDSNSKFEALLKQKFPEHAKDCSEFIRHKTTLVYPGLLVENGISMTKGVHREGEFMISRCSGYHAGFNTGFNIAEAVNFALPDWLKVAKTVKTCKCVSDSVRFNMGSFMSNVKASEHFHSILRNESKRQC